MKTLWTQENTLNTGKTHKQESSVVKGLAPSPKPDNLSWIPESHRGEEEGSRKCLGAHMG